MTTTTHRDLIDHKNMFYHRNGSSGFGFFCMNSEAGIVVRFGDYEEGTDPYTGETIELYYDAGSAAIPVQSMQAAADLPESTPRGVLCEVNCLSHNGLRAFVAEAGDAPPTFKGNVYHYDRFLVVIDPTHIVGEGGKFINPKIAVFDLDRVLNGDLEHNTWRGDHYVEFAVEALTSNAPVA